MQSSGRTYRVYRAGDYSQTNQPQSQPSSSNTTGALVIYLIVSVVLAVVAAVIITVMLVVVRTRSPANECFFVTFPNGTFPESQSAMDNVLKAMGIGYASHSQLQAAFDAGAQWCQAGFFDLDLPTAIITGIGWPNHVVGSEKTCGVTGVNYIAVPAISPPNGGPRTADLQKFASKVTGFIAYGVKPDVNNVNPPGSILPFAPGRWSQADDAAATTEATES